MHGDVLIGGGFFTHDRLQFVDLINRDTSFTVKKLERSDVVKPVYKTRGDYTVLLGIKGIERILRKERHKPKVVSRKMRDFLSKVISAKKPLIVIDDWSLPLLKKYGRAMRKFLFDNFNVKSYLLREYLSKESYRPEVVPFSLPCNDFPELVVPFSQKSMDIFFQGNDSHADRRELLKGISKHTRSFRCNYKLMKGGTKNVKDRIGFTEFLKTMAKSHICLSFSGSGYDCYRYHEIPAVGSIIATPDYPLVIRNDYQDMKSKIIYSGVSDFANKVSTVLKSKHMLEDMQQEARNNFVKFHTSQVRYNELKDFIKSAI